MGGEAEAKAPGASSSPTALGCTLCYITLVYYPGGWRSRGARRTGPRTYLAAADDLTPNLRACEFCAHLGIRVLYWARVRMRGTEDAPPPLEHVLHDCLGFEHVVACVVIKRFAPTRAAASIQTRVVAGALGIVRAGQGTALTEHER